LPEFRWSREGGQAVGMITKRTVLGAAASIILAMSAPAASSIRPGGHQVGSPTQPKAPTAAETQQLIRARTYTVTAKTREEAIAELKGEAQQQPSLASAVRAAENRIAAWDEGNRPEKVTRQELQRNLQTAQTAQAASQSKIRMLQSVIPTLPSKVGTVTGRSGTR
jgi:hypothetical protein